MSSYDTMITGVRLLNEIVAVADDLAFKSPRLPIFSQSKENWLSCDFVSFLNYRIRNRLIWYRLAQGCEVRASCIVGSHRVLEIR